MAALLILVACAQATTTETSTITDAATPTTATPTTDTTSSTTTTTVTTTSEAVGPLETTQFKVPFSIVAPALWRFDDEVGDSVVFFSAAPGQWLVFTTVGQPDIEAWVEFLTTTPELIATEPMPAEIDSATGVTLDVRISANATDAGFRCSSSVPCVGMFDYAPSPEENTGWIIEEGLVDRVWVVDVDGETVAIFAEAREAGFATWIAEVETALATVEWT